MAIDSTCASKRTQHNMGAFGGFGFSYTEITSREALGINIQGGIIYDHWLASGVHLHTFFTVSPLSDRYTNDDASLLGGYGGLFVAPVIRPGALIHVSVPVFVGYGSVSYELYNNNESVNRIEDSSGFWVLQPGMEVELNVLRFVRVAIGGYYRYCGNISLKYENGSDLIVPRDFLNNFSLGIKVRFGKF